MSGSKPRIEAALRLYREGRLEQALQAFDAIVESDPASAPARSLRGLTRCHLGDLEQGVADLREAVRMSPRDANLQARLGMILYVQDRVDEAHSALRRALVHEPGHPEALANMSLVLRARGDFAGAERAARAALAVRADFPEARVNLGYALLAQGKFAQGWEAVSFRPNPQVNLRDPGLVVTAPHDSTLPAAQAPIILHGEQGLGDTLFFLRFAPQLRARGHRLAFWGDARLHPLLARSALFEHFLRPDSVPGPGLTLLWAGDLPHLLGAVDPQAFPPALPLLPDPARAQAMRARLNAWGPAPHVGVTWRAGLERAGRVALSKSVPAAALGAALAPVHATFVSLQRNAREDELRDFRAGLGAPVHDAGFVNDDLEDALAMMSLLDEYVSVSNTNTHLRAGTGRTSKVLVPWPPEWRWQERAERSAWFPAVPIYRQSPGGDWTHALERLAGSFTGS